MEHLSTYNRVCSSQLELEVDGLPLLSAPVAAYAVQAAAAHLTPVRLETLNWLRNLPRNQVSVLSEQFDGITGLLGILGIQSSPIASEDLAQSKAQIAFAGCPHRHTRLDRQDVMPFLGRGGLLVSSDRAATMAGLASYVHTDPPRPPRRARVDLTDPCCADQRPGVLLPTVALDPGHRPLAPALLDRPGVRMLARDALTDDPLAISIATGSGTILHSVPHWFQELHAERMTALDQRPLADIDCYADIGNSYPGVTLAALQAARTMLEILLAGVGFWIRSATPAFNLTNERE